MNEPQLQLPAARGLSLNNIALAVESLDEMVTWYVTVLGFEAIERGRLDAVGADYATLSGAGFRLELVSLPGAPRHPADHTKPPGHPATLGWQAIVLRSENLGEAMAVLRTHDVGIVWAESQLSTTLISTVIRDPEGNFINIFGVPESA
ncbi:Glyoxalase/Bleomycin resistance protein/Dioxygenase superfamily protein [Caballeronia arationis]|uniref:VOC family protein n=1 Tax=Caballeronia arationis TaxID=1777142 RepID=UPI00074C00F1|nr:VOC family protein [Caballeronia arationis]SAK89347.1 Glyoxalase/Bleomycin resistance protein/Dioxygenase superfamily protein [Caballeronia arationis]